MSTGAARGAALAAVATLALGLCLQVRADEAEDWFNAPTGPSTESVNEGALVFLARFPERSVHYQRNHIVIGEHSLADGWIDLHQCHDRLDAVPRSQVVFHRERTRSLRIISAEGIGEVWIEGNTVQLKDTRPGAHLCLSVESHALEADGTGGYTLRNGPFMRRFLDGYYPMHVATRVTVEPARLRYASITPAIQPGFAVWETDRDIHIDALFEGRLMTRMLFRSID